MQPLYPDKSFIIILKRFFKIKIGNIYTEFYTNFYFSKFFGSRLLGLFFLSLLLFLILKNLKLVLTDKYLRLMLIIIILSYLHHESKW
mgnify:CR=1 FL=1